MERKKILTLLVGLVVGVATIAIGVRLFTGTIEPAPCPLEFHVYTLNTSHGWFYAVAGMRESRPLEVYNVTFFLYSAPDQYGNQVERVNHSGPLKDLEGAAGNFTFDDRGQFPGMLDSGGDYFRAREWHSLRVERAGRISGGTLGCG